MKPHHYQRIFTLTVKLHESLDLYLEKWKNCESTKSKSLNSLNSHTSESKDKTFDDFGTGLQIHQCFTVISSFLTISKPSIRIAILRVLYNILVSQKICQIAVIERVDYAIIKLFEYLGKKPEENEYVFRILQRWMQISKEEFPFSLIKLLLSKGFDRPSLSLLSEFIITAPISSVKYGVYESVLLSTLKHGNGIGNQKILFLESISFALCSNANLPFNPIETVILQIFNSPVHKQTQINVAEQVLEFMLATWNGLKFFADGPVDIVLKYLKNKHKNLRLRAVNLLYKILGLSLTKLNFTPSEIRSQRNTQFFDHSLDVQQIKLNICKREESWAPNFCLSAGFFVSEALSLFHTEIYRANCGLDMNKIRNGLVIKLLLDKGLPSVLKHALVTPEELEDLSGEIPWNEQEVIVKKIACIFAQITEPVCVILPQYFSPQTQINLPPEKNWFNGHSRMNLAISYISDVVKATGKRKVLSYVLQNFMVNTKYVTRKEMERKKVDTFLNTKVEIEFGPDDEIIHPDELLWQNRVEKPKVHFIEEKSSSDIGETSVDVLKTPDSGYNEEFSLRRSMRLGKRRKFIYLKGFLQKFIGGFA